MKPLKVLGGLMTIAFEGVFTAGVIWAMVYLAIKMSGIPICAK